MIRLDRVKITSNTSNISNSNSIYSIHTIYSVHISNRYSISHSFRIGLIDIMEGIPQGKGLICCRR